MAREAHMFQVNRRRKSEHVPKVQALLFSSVLCCLAELSRLDMGNLWNWTTISPRVAQVVVLSPWGAHFMSSRKEMIFQRFPNHSGHDFTLDNVVTWIRHNSLGWSVRGRGPSSTQPEKGMPKRWDRTTIAPQLRHTLSNLRKLLFCSNRSSLAKKGTKEKSKKTNERTNEQEISKTRNKSKQRS